MRIALVGYGKMGKAIEAIAKSRGHSISYIIDKDNPELVQDIRPDNTDIAIEFSQPDAAFENIKALVTNRVKTLSGTTGWLHKYDDIKKICEEKSSTFLYASNYSIGVNLFFALNEWLASKMSKLEGFNATMEEIHHTEKKDSPSGTAITLAEGIIKNHGRYAQWKNEQAEETNVVPIISKREAHVPGTHSITYTSEMETISIEHVAHDRKIFAEGVILVAEWASNKTGILSYNDFLSDL